MARTLTKKQRGFVNTYVETGNGSLAAKQNYSVSTDESARSVASQNLTKDSIKEELKKLGFDSNTAKQVVGEILIGGENDTVKLRAAEIIFKVHGDNAPDKHININLPAPLYGGKAE